MQWITSFFVISAIHYSSPLFADQACLFIMLSLVGGEPERKILQIFSNCFWEAQF